MLATTPGSTASPGCAVAAWPQRQAFLDTLEHALAALPPRRAYYPRAADIHAAFLERHPDGSGEDTLPWTLVRDTDDPDNRASHDLGVLPQLTAETALPGRSVMISTVRCGSATTRCGARSAHRRQAAAGPRDHRRGSRTARGAASCATARCASTPGPPSRNGAQRAELVPIPAIPTATSSSARHRRQHVHDPDVGARTISLLAAAGLGPATKSYARSPTSGAVPPVTLTRTVAQALRP